MSNKLFQPAYSFEDELQLAYTKRIRDVILKRGLSQYNITVSDDDVSRAFTQLFGDDATSAEAAALVEQTMGLSPKEFMETTLRTYVEQQKLDAAVAKDAQLVRKNKELADGIFAQISRDSAASLMKVAEQHDDAVVKYAPSSYIGRNDIAGLFTPILTCEKGKILPIIVTDKAYIIFRCLDVLPADVSPEARTHFNVEQLAILKPSFFQWLADEFTSASISLYPKGIEWDATCQQAVIAGNLCISSVSSTSQESEALKQLLSGSQGFFPSFIK